MDPLSGKMGVIPLLGTAYQERGDSVKGGEISTSEKKKVRPDRVLLGLLSPGWTNGKKGGGLLRGYERTRGLRTRKKIKARKIPRPAASGDFSKNDREIADHRKKGLEKS